MKVLARLLGLALCLCAPISAAENAPAPIPPPSSKVPASETTSPSYIIHNTDTLNIIFYDEPDLSIRSRVDANGNVNLNLIGAVTIAGLTVSEAQAAIEKSYRDGRYLRAPQVTINIEQYAPQEVSIQGQVRSPGRYPLPIETTMTVVQLVTKAGGFTDIARGRKVTVSRVGKDGKAQVFTVDVYSIITGEIKNGKNAPDESLVLQDGDNVYVPESII
jgi:polysaccharide export outer membrane protein